MTRRSVVILSFLGLLIVGGAALQTPLLRQTRNWAWTGWVSTVARLLHIELEEPDQQRLEKLISENIRLHSELKDYTILKQNLGSPSFEGFKAIPAAFIARPIDTFHSEFIISRGAHEGITLMAPVVIQGSTLIGFVSELNDHTAIVRLLTHPSTTLAADVIDPTLSVDEISTSGLVQGKSYTSLFLTTIPRDKPLHEESRVITQAKPGELPAGLFVGTVKTIRDQKEGAYKEAILDVPYSSGEIRAVNVLVLP